MYNQNFTESLVQFAVGRYIFNPVYDIKLIVIGSRAPYIHADATKRQCGRHGGGRRYPSRSSFGALLSHHIRFDFMYAQTVRDFEKLRVTSNVSFKGFVHFLIIDYDLIKPTRFKELLDDVCFCSHKLWCYLKTHQQCMVIINMVTYIYFRGPNVNFVLRGSCCASSLSIYKYLLVGS